MTGGLVQIVAFGTQDIFLTGDPQITFFKVVYRRYTNFAIESVEEFFDGEPNFGEKVTLTLAKNGDLVHKMYLKVDIPEVQLKKIIDTSIVPDLQLERDTALADFENFEAYSGWILGGYRTIIQECQILNHTAASIAEELNTYFTTEVDITDFNNRKNNIDNNEQVTRTDIFLIIKNINENPLLTDEEKLTEMKSANERVKNNIITFHKGYYDDFLAKDQALIDAQNDNANFAWVKKLGHFIIDKVDILIGGDRIDRHHNDWLNIWNELSRNIHLDEIYNVMIGNVEVLTTYNQEVTPRYTLFIPLQFWFCRHNGSALPLIPLQYHDVRIDVEFNKLASCIFTDFDDTDNVLIDLIKIINASLYIDYIYLDNDERRKFAQSSHEYLIEYVQRNQITDVFSASFTFELDLYHPCKEIIWVVQSEKKIEERNQLDDYSITDNQTGNPIKSVLLELNGYKRLQRLDGTYFNYLQPWQHHSNTPSDGINVYSFALHPEEHQPSGTLNFSRIDVATLNVIFEEEYISAILLDGDSITFKLFAHTYNILRFRGGMAGLAFAV